MSTVLHLAVAPIAQSDLELLLSLETQIRQLRRLRNQNARAIIDRLMAGHDVERGRHSAEIDVSPRGASHDYALLIDGRRIR